MCFFYGLHRHFQSTSRRTKKSKAEREEEEEENKKVLVLGKPLLFTMYVYIVCVHVPLTCPLHSCPAPLALPSIGSSGNKLN